MFSNSQNFKAWANLLPTIYETEIGSMYSKTKMEKFGAALFKVNDDYHGNWHWLHTAK